MMQSQQGKTIRLCLLAGLCTALAGTVPAAAGGDDRGRAIYAQRDRNDTGFGTQQVRMHMQLRSPEGRSAERDLEIRVREGDEGKGDRILLVFDAPRDIAGTALLTHERRGAEDDDQWLYMPAYKRTKRIAGGDRSGRFVGTEFSYEDLAGDPVEDFRYRYLREDRYRNRAVHVIDRMPNNPNSAYSRQETWVDASNRQILKALLFDQKGRHVKTLETSDWKRYQGRYWRPQRLVMTHVPSGRSTEMTAGEYRFDVELRKRDFHPKAFGRRRR